MSERISADFSDDIHEIARELYGRDDRSAQRRVHYLVSEIAPEQRLAGLFKVGHKVCMSRSVLREAIRRRALGEAAATAQS